jgi:hypothetical protein
MRWQQGPGLALVASFLGAAAANGQCPSDWMPIPGAFADPSNWPWPLPLGTYRGDLVIGGRFRSIGGLPMSVAARWDGSRWIAMTAGAPPDLEVRSGLQFGDDFYAAGSYCTPQACGGAIFRWDGLQWHQIHGLDGGTRVLTVYDGHLIAAGTSFVGPNGTTIEYLARWNGSQWLPMGQPPPAVTWEYGDLATYNGQLYAGTFYGQVFRWNGTAWVLVVGTAGPPGYAPYIRDLEVYNGSLIVGGFFARVGSVPADSIAAWDGTTWRSLGGVVFNTGGVWHPEVLELFVAQGLLRVRGYLTSAFQSNAVWNGSSWNFAPTGWQARWPLVHYRSTIASTELGTGGPPQAPRAALWQFPACYANCDCSSWNPQLNANDLICFLRKFLAHEPYANCDGSTTPPVLDIADIVCFLRHFREGCP